MKRASEIATLWDGKPDTEETAAAALDFVGDSPNPRRGKASVGLGHCLRAMEQDEVILDHCAGLALDFLGRQGLGRPGLRLMTTCMIAESCEPNTSNAVYAGYQMARLLDDPQLVGAIKPRLRMESEAVLVHVLGTATPRGRKAIPACLLTIQADRNDRPWIPARDKRSYLEYLRSAAAAAGMGNYADRAGEIERQLEKRVGIPRCKQAGCGIFYEL